MFKLLFNIFKNAIQIYSSYPRETREDKFKEYLKTITNEDIKKLRINSFTYKIISRFYKGIMYFGYLYMNYKWEYNSLIVTGTYNKNKEYYRYYADKVIDIIEYQFKPNKMITLDKRIDSSGNVKWKGLGDSLKWHGAYIAALHRLGYDDLVETNLEALGGAINHSIQRHDAPDITKTHGISTCSVSGLAQALLITGDTRYQKQIKDIMDKTDYFLPDIDGSATKYDLNRNVISNSITTLSYIALRLIAGEELTKDDIDYLKNATDWKIVDLRLDGDRSFYGNNTNVFLADAIMTAKPELKEILIPFVERLMEANKGECNPDILSVLAFHNNRYFSSIVIEQMFNITFLPEIKKDRFGQEGCFSSCVFGNEIYPNISDEALPIEYRANEDYAWQRSPYEFSRKCGDTLHPRLDYLVPLSRIIKLKWN